MLQPRKVQSDKIKQHKKRVNYTINKHTIDRFKVVADKDMRKMSNIKEYASHPTIFKIIDYAVSKKYFEKIIDKSDKRKYNLFPTSQTIKEFEEWAKLFKGF